MQQDATPIPNNSLIVPNFNGLTKDTATDKDYWQAKILVNDPT